MITTKERTERGRVEVGGDGNNITSGIVRWILGLMASGFLALVGLIGWGYSNLNLQLTEARGIVRQHEQQISAGTALGGTMAADIQEIKLDIKEIKSDVKIIVKETYIKNSNISK